MNKKILTSKSDKTYLKPLNFRLLIFWELFQKNFFLSIIFNSLRKKGTWPFQFDFLNFNIHLFGSIECPFGVTVYMKKCGRYGKFKRVMIMYYIYFLKLQGFSWVSSDCESIQFFFYSILSLFLLWVIGSIRKLLNLNIFQHCMLNGK